MGYLFRCSCGEMVRINAETKDDAIDKIHSYMTPEMLLDHLIHKHAGQSIADANLMQQTVYQSVHVVNAN